MNPNDLHHWLDESLGSKITIALGLQPSWETKENIYARLN
jgi:hypothetical protein